jgi:hypothetical protein
MIYDFATEVEVTSKAAGQPFWFPLSSFDLLDGNDGVPPLFGTGERLYMQFEVTTAFAVEGETTPVAQFGIVVDDTATPSTSSHILALTGGTIATDYVGFVASQLTLGKVFHLPIPAWEDVLEATGSDWPNTSSAASLTAFHGMRYMAPICHIPNSNESAGTTGFSAGAIKGRIVKDIAGKANAINVYPGRSEIL